MALWIVAIFGAADLTVVSSAFAARPHFVSGPTITTSNTGVTACGKIAGLGNSQQVTVIVEATVTTTCTNRGGNIPPGQTQEVSGEGDFSSDQNGTVSFCVTTDNPTNPCPKSMRPNNTFSDISVIVLDSQGRPIIR